MMLLLSKHQIFGKEITITTVYYNFNVYRFTFASIINVRIVPLLLLKYVHCMDV